MILSVFLGPDEQLQVFECPGVVWSVISEGHLSSQHEGCYVSWQQVSHQTQILLNESK